MNEEKIIAMLIDHEDRLIRIEENMLTKTEFYLFQDEFLQSQDQMIKILTRMDDNLAMTNAGMKRMQEILGRHDEKILEHEAAIAGIQTHLQNT